jgi:hypothetical protein
VAEEPKLAAFRVEHLYAGKVGVHEGLGGIEDLLVQSLGALSSDQLSGDLLKPLCGLNLQRELLLASAQCLLSGSQFPSALPPDLLHS